jgi:hypothetical protein
MMATTVGYPGGKSGDGVYQRIINLLPPHETYVEPFLGGGAIMAHKRPARLNIGLDLDASVIAEWEASIAPKSSDEDLGDAFRFHCADGITFLEVYPFTGRELVYCDPPYLRHTRSGAGALYRFEMTDEQHERLLRILVQLSCSIVISGYWSELYSTALADWEHVSFQAMTRRGPATEHLWFNFQPPEVLHDYSFLGRNFRERERIARRRRRWVRRIQWMPALERNALISALVSEAGPRSRLAMPSEPRAAPFAAMSAEEGGDSGIAEPGTLSPLAGDGARVQSRTSTRPMECHEMMGPAPSTSESSTWAWNSSVSKRTG